MKNIFPLLIIISLITTIHLTAQEDAEQGLLENYDEIIDKSNNYEDYKVVKKLQLKNFRRNLAQELEQLDTEISELEKSLKDEKNKIADLQNQLENTQNKLQKTTSERDQIFLFGSPMSKDVYQTTMWGIIGALIILLILLLIKFKANNNTTNEAKKQLNSVEKEFEDYKRKALEKQQKLGRELQDQKNLVNKLKGNKQ